MASEIIPWGHLVRRHDWEGGPVDYVNASQMKLASQGAEHGLHCATAWAIRYLFGRETPRVDRGPLLGTLLHRAARHYHATGSPMGYVPAPQEAADLYTWAKGQAAKHGGNVNDWGKVLYDEAIHRLKPGLVYQPRNPDAVVEETFRMVFEGILLGGTRDIAVKKGPAFVQDHKTTRGKYIKGMGLDKWFYVPTPEELSWDAQFLLYMLRCAFDQPAQLYIHGQWIYYLTDEKSDPECKTVDVWLDRYEVISRFKKRWLPWARYVKGWVDWYKLNGPPTLAAFPRASNPNHELAPCRQYGGCDKSIKDGGPCNVYVRDDQRTAYLIATAKDI